MSAERGDDRIEVPSLSDDFKWVIIDGVLVAEEREPYDHPEHGPERVPFERVRTDPTDSPRGEGVDLGRSLTSIENERDRPDSGERGTTYDGIPYRKHSWAGWVLVRERLHCACGHDYRDHTSHGCLMCDCDREVVPAWAYDEELPSRLRTGAGEVGPPGVVHWCPNGEKIRPLPHLACSLCRVDGGAVTYTPIDPGSRHAEAFVKEVARGMYDDSDPKSYVEYLTERARRLTDHPDPSTRSEGSMRGQTKEERDAYREIREEAFDPAPTGSGAEVKPVDIHIMADQMHNDAVHLRADGNKDGADVLDRWSRKVHDSARRLRSTSEGGRERVLSRLQRADNMLVAVLANHPESNFVDDRVRESRREIRSVLEALDGRE